MLPCLLEIHYIMSSGLNSVNCKQPLINPLPTNSRVKSEAANYIFIIKFDLRKPRDTNVSWKSTGKFFFFCKYPAFLEF